MDDDNFGNYIRAITRPYIKRKELYRKILTKYPMTKDQFYSSKPFIVLIALEQNACWNHTLECVKQEYYEGISNGELMRLVQLRMNMTDSQFKDVRPIISEIVLNGIFVNEEK